MQRVHKQEGARTYLQLLNVPGLETEAEPRSSETHVSVLSTELCRFLVACVERAPKNIGWSRFFNKKHGAYFKRQN